MKAEDRYHIIESEFDNKYWVELIYIPVIGSLFIGGYYFLSPEIVVEYQKNIFLFVFGSLHILASNVLSFLYNISWVVLPFAPKVTSKRLKIIGTIALSLCLLGLVTY